MSFRIIYDRSRFPIRQKREDGEWGCRGCGEPIPKGRRSWCSSACIKKFEPASVIHAVKQRDKEICCDCGFDCGKAEIKWRAERYDPPKGWTYDDWQRREPPIAEYDHVIPFSEGGLTVLENMRTLCSACHRKRTAKWRADKAKATRVAIQPELLPC